MSEEKAKDAWGPNPEIPDAEGEGAEDSSELELKPSEPEGAAAADSPADPEAEQGAAQPPDMELAGQEPDAADEPEPPQPEPEDSDVLEDLEADEAVLDEVTTPLVNVIDKGIGLMRFLKTRPQAFHSLSDRLTKVGLYAVLCLGVLGLAEGIVGAIKFKAFNFFLYCLLSAPIAVVLHYCAARFAPAGKRIIARETKRMATPAILDCLGMLAALAVVVLLVLGVVQCFRLGGVSPLWPHLIYAVCAACLAVFALNPRETVNVDVVAEEATAGETALAFLTFLVRSVLAASTILLGLGVTICAVWMLVAMVGSWMNQTQLVVVFESFSTACAFALMPLLAYISYLFYMLGVDLYMAALRIAHNTEKPED